MVSFIYREHRSNLKLLIFVLYFGNIVNQDFDDFLNYINKLGLRFPIVPPFEAAQCQGIESDPLKFFDAVGMTQICQSPYCADNKGHSIAPIIVIDEYHGLTTYNPHRELSKNKTMIHLLHALFPSRRVYKYDENKEQKTLSMYGGIFQVKCARQIVPIDEEILTEQDLWFGGNNHRRNSPVHDLMVIRFKEKFKFHEQIEETEDLKKEKIENVILVELATVEDKIEETLAIASIGCIDDLHITDHQVMIAKSYNIAETDIIVDCDQYLPRNWGHLLCLRNLEKFEGWGSGSVLESNGKVFGLGNFLLDKSNDSILVFTDVRKYHHLIIKGLNCK